MASIPVSILHKYDYAQLLDEVGVVVDHVSILHKYDYADADRRMTWGVGLCFNST